MSIVLHVQHTGIVGMLSRHPNPFFDMSYDYWLTLFKQSTAKEGELATRHNIYIYIYIYIYIFD